MNIPMIRRLLVSAPLLLCAAFARPAAADSTIYRCHALDGKLVFQDRPCNTVGGTREAAANSEGEQIHVAPTPPQEGTSAAEHYNRYLDFVSRDRREQQAADEAEADRLRAEAEADRAAAAAEAPAARSPSNCSLFGPDGECVASGYLLPYGYLPPPHRHPHPPYHGPYRPPAPSVTPDNQPFTPRPVGPNPPPKRPSRDPRSEILSLTPP